MPRDALTINLRERQQTVEEQPPVGRILAARNNIGYVTVRRGPEVKVPEDGAWERVLVAHVVVDVLSPLERFTVVVDN